MSQDYFNLRWCRLFSEAGSPTLTGKEAMFFAAIDHDYRLESVSVSVGFSRTNLNVRGSRRVEVKKLHLASLFKNVPPLVFCYTPRSTREVAQALIERYALPLHAEWFVDTPIAVDIGNNPPFKVNMNLLNTEFTMADNDPTEVTVGAATVDIGDVFKFNVLDVPVLPFTVRTGYTNTELTTYGLDFTPEFIEDFRNIRAITKSADLYASSSPEIDRSSTLVRIMTSRLDFEVTTEGDIEDTLSTKNATFVYNGPSQGFAASDTSYDNVLVFDTVLDPVDSTARTYRGRCYVHYNNLS